ncbi:Predicted ATPase [Leclercia adecarboxylata]|uniref:Predicted ATPase n=1 Tax=Leclercia adecarboxylata TaxID=83655 RepID=A0A4U9HI12_9ENTR|nr:Predicted ATPase [Leclercia adecarboxylata]
MAISGPSGIGKSSLIASGLKALQHRSVLLAVGKVDQFSPTLPYAALTSAFRTLVLHLLGLSAEEVAQWKVRPVARAGGLRSLSRQPGAGAAAAAG